MTASGRAGRPDVGFVLHINVQRFRGGLVFKAHRLCVSLNSRLESNKEEEGEARGGMAAGVRVTKDGEGKSRSTCERDFFIDNLLVRNHLIIVMSRWTGLAPWEFEIPVPGSLTSTFLRSGGSVTNDGEWKRRSTCDVQGYLAHKKQPPPYSQA